MRRVIEGSKGFDVTQTLPPQTTRIAPSPTGMMHIGTARTALFNWLIARATGGRFILRMDDTDADRNSAEAEQPIHDGLAWLGIEPDAFERQSARSGIHLSWAERLLEAGMAVRAENGAIVLAWRDSMPRTWRDEIGGEQRITDEMVKHIDGRLVLTRGGDKLGSATYQFASILDDWLMDVTWIVRGTDHIANTSKQIAILTALNAVADPKPVPRFSHVGLIFRDGRKMSKRDGAASLLDYRDAGTDPDAMFNFLLRTGWGPKVDDRSTATIDRARALELFLEGGSMKASSAGFDAAKLASFDRKYKAAREKAASGAPRT